MPENFPAPEKTNPDPEEIIIEGQRYKKVPSGYTIRQFYSHETIEKGPGPGWDTRWEILEKYGVREPSALPDEPHYYLEHIEETEQQKNNNSL